ncbi:MAG: hypothetical protein ACYDA3_09470 [Gaiellaceae bacterium]
MRGATRSTAATTLRRRRCSRRRTNRQSNTELVLADAAQARTWNGGLPCSGTIVALETKSQVVPMPIA